MQKIFFLSILLFSVAQANLQENLIKLIKQKTKQDVKVLEVYDLQSDKNLKIVILEDMLSKSQVPIITNKDGNLLFALTNIFFSNHHADLKQVEQIIQKIQTQNNQQANSASLNKLFESIPDDYLIKLESTTKNNKKRTYIVSDPMCPHCQDELRQIQNRLKDSNVYMVLVAYLGQQSLDKAAVILEKIKTLKDTKQKIDLLQQVYATTYKATDPNPKELQKVENITKKIADSNLIKGVPFVYEYQ